MIDFIRREKIYILILFFIIALNLLNLGRSGHKHVEETKAVSSMTFNEIGVTEQRVKDYINSDRSGAGFFRYGFIAGAFLFLLSLIVNIKFILSGKKIGINAPACKGPVLWGIRDVIRATLIIVFFAYVLAIAENFIFRAYHIYIETNSLMMLNTFIIDMVAAIAVFYFAMVKNKEKLCALGIRSRFFLKGVFTGITAYIMILPFLLAVLLLSIIVLNFLGYKPPPQPVFEAFMEEKRINMLFFLVIFVSIVGPVIEEIFFRGFMYGAIKKRFGIITAVLLSASLFSLLHANVVGFLPIMILGALLAYLYETTGSLASSMTVHIIHNSVMVSLVFFIKEVMA
jgi:membrane protease YdiL (CAAX protease family)